MSRKKPSEFMEACQKKLVEVWDGFAQSETESELPTEIKQDIETSVNSPTMTYRYVVLTQLLSKATDISLDCHCVQAGGETDAGSFDARSVCHKIIVPFDRSHNNVLGGSTEPYASNPIRIKKISQEYLTAQKNKAGFTTLIKIFDHIEAYPAQAQAALNYCLQRVRKRMEIVNIIFPVPNRISEKQTLNLIEKFLAVKTGGARFQVVSSALFRTLGESFSLYEHVESSKPNAADASTGNTADIDCINQDGETVIAVEAKDQKLTIRHVQDKLTRAKEKRIKELLFLVRTDNGEILNGTAEEIKETITREFNQGHNIYTKDFNDFLPACLVLLGEEGRRKFLENIGLELNEKNLDLKHKEAWKALLDDVSRS